MLNKTFASANTQGELCITFSDAGDDPVEIDRKPNSKKTKK
jgi:hypothetical protein